MSEQSLQASKSIGANFLDLLRICMATAIDWGFYSGWLRLQIDRENRQALFDVMAEIPHLQLGNFVSGTVYLLACRTVQSLGVKVTGQKNMLHHLNPAELSQLGSKLPTTEIKTFDDFDKIIPNGKEVILKIIDNIIDDLKGIAGSTLRSLIIYLTADILTYPLLLVNTRLTAQYPFEEPKYKGFDDLISVLSLLLSLCVFHTFNFLFFELSNFFTSCCYHFCPFHVSAADNKLLL